MLLSYDIYFTCYKIFVPVSVSVNMMNMDDSHGDSGEFAPPVLALDRLKQAGVPLKAHMSPYLQVRIFLKLIFH